MLPEWTQRYVNTDSFFEGRSHEPLYTLITLLQEIGQFVTGKPFLLVEPPRSLVWHATTGMYLYHEGSRVPFATFEMAGQPIHSIGLRYNEPLDPASKCRNERIVTGWQGTAELIASAVKRSPYYGKLETIEVSSQDEVPYYPDVDRTSVSTYEVWATPRKTWSVGWHSWRSLVEDEDTGELNWFHIVDQLEFSRNSPVMLARIELERPISDENPEVQLELVRSICLYPQIPLHDDFDWEISYQSDGYRLITADISMPIAKGGLVVEKLPLNREQPFRFLPIEGDVLNFPPHSELKLNFGR